MSLEDSWDIIVLDKLIDVKHSWCDCADRWIRVSQRQIKPRPVWRTKRQLRSECKPDPNALWVQHQSSFGTPSWLACCVSLECWLCKSLEISATCVQDAICNMHMTGRSCGGSVQGCDRVRILVLFYILTPKYKMCFLLAPAHYWLWAPLGQKELAPDDQAATLHGSLYGSAVSSR